MISELEPNLRKKRLFWLHIRIDHMESRVGLGRLLQSILVISLQCFKAQADDGFERSEGPGQESFGQSGLNRKDTFQQ